MARKHSLRLIQCKGVIMTKTNEILILDGLTLEDIHTQINFFLIEMGNIPILQVDTLPTHDGYVCHVEFYLDEDLKRQYEKYKKKAKSKKFLDDYMRYKEELNVD